MNIDYIDHFGLVLFLGIEGIFSYKYIKYWLQLKKALQEDKDSTVPLYSQKELNEGADKSLKLGSKMIMSNTAVSGQILFSLKTNNPKLSVPLKRIRRAILLFCITPFVFAVVLISVTIRFSQ